MIVVDANLLLYAVNRDLPQHEVARAWWESVLSRNTPVGLAWGVMLAFLRISTHPRIFERPLPPTGPRDLDRKRGWTHKRVSNAKLVSTGWQPRFPCFLDAAREILPTLELV